MAEYRVRGVTPGMKTQCMGRRPRGAPADPGKDFRHEAPSWKKTALRGRRGAYHRN